MQYVTVLLIFGLTLVVSAPVKQGCYSADDVETEALFLLSSGSSSTNVSVSSCSVLCGLWDNLYAGVLDGSHCVCDDTTPTSSASSNASCADPCDVANSEECGSAGLLVVYESTSIIEDLKLRIQTLTELLFPNATFVELSIEPAEDIGFSYSLDDGSGEYEVSNSTLFRHHLFSPGDHVLTAYATNAAQWQTSSVVGVRVEASAQGWGNMSLSCLKDEVEIYETIECDVTIPAGTVLNITEDDGNNTWIVEGSSYTVAGPQFTEDSSAYVAGRSDIPVLMPNSEIRNPGYVTAFRMQGAVSGLLHIRIYKPQCLDFCFWTHQCGSACDSQLQSCDLCHIRDQCCNYSDTGRYSNTASMTWTPHWEYRDYNLQTGSQVLILNETLWVEAGYILGFESSDGSATLSQLNSTDSGVDYEQNTPPTALTEGRHLLQALVSSGTIATIFREPQHIPGEVQLVIQLADLTTMEEITVTTSPNITVLEETTTSTSTSTSSTTTTTASTSTSTSSVTSTSVTSSTAPATSNTPQSFTTSSADIFTTSEQATTLSSTAAGSTASGSTASGSTASGSTAPGSTAPGSTGAGSTASFTSTTTPGGMAPTIVSSSMTASQSTSGSTDSTTTSAVYYPLEIISFAVVPSANLYLHDTFNISWYIRSSDNITCYVAVITNVTINIVNNDYAACDSPSCTDTYTVNVTDVSTDLNVSITCQSDSETVTDYVVVTVLQRPNAPSLLNPVISSAGGTTLHITSGGDILDQLIINIDQVGIINATYDSETGYYVADLPGMDVGNLVISITASNGAGSITTNYTLHVLDPIDGLSLKTDYGDLTNNDTLVVTDLTFEEATTTGFNLAADIASGSNVSLHVDWGDGTTSSTAPPLNLSHVYTTGGDYLVSVTASSPLNDVIERSIELIVVNPLPDPNLLEIVMTEILYTETGEFAVGYQIAYNSGVGGPLLHIPNQVHMLMSGGDSGQKHIEPMSLDTTYVYEYADVYTVDVVVYLSNPIGENITLTKTFELTWPITDMYLIVEPAHAIPGEMVNISISMMKGDDVTLTWEFGDGITPQVIRPRIGDATSVDTQSHIYNTEGSYNINITAENNMGRVDMQYVIHILKPIMDNMFIVETNAPIVYPEPLVVSVTYVGDMADYPDDVTLEIISGDGQRLELDLTAEMNMTFTFNMTTPGEYRGAVSASNLATAISVPIDVATIELIENVTLDILWQPDIPRSAPPQPGIGGSGNILPINYPIVFDVGAAKGAPISYIVELFNLDTGLSEIHVCNSTPILLQMSEAGEYNMTLTAMNPLSSVSVSSIVSVQDSVSKSSDILQDIGNSTARPGDLKLFELNVDSQCIECCVTVDFGDGYFEYYSYSDGTGTNFCGNHTLSGDLLSTPLTLGHIYSSEGQYVLSVTIDDPFSSQTVDTTFSVSTRDCAQPKLSIDGQRKSFLDSLLVLRSVMSTTLAYTGLVCSDTLVNQKLWKVYKLDDEVGTRLSEIDMSSIDTRLTAQLVLPQQFLEYGFYELEYSVMMTPGKDGVPFSSKVSTFIEIVRSDLITRMVYGGLSRMTRGSNQTVTLNVNKFSIDPDLPNGQKPVLTDFYWFCRREGEDFDTDYLTGEILLEPIHSAQDSYLVTPDDGGCYSTGPGRIDLHTGKVEISTALLLAGMTYEFTAQVISADNRTGIARLMIEIIDEPYTPVISIRCADGGICKQVQGGQQVNPTNRLAFYAECFTQNCLPPLVYHWSISYLDQYKFWRRIYTDQKYIEGAGSRGIGVSEQLFTDYPDVDQFQFRLMLDIEAGTPRAQSGNAWMNVKVNSPPHSGWCYHSPKYVLSSREPIFVNCYDWLDDTGIMRYEVYANYKNGSHLVHYDGSFNSAAIYLPAGEPEENFYMGLEVRVINVDKAFTVYSMGDVRVERAELPDVYKDMSETVFEDSYDLELVLQGGDIQEMSKEIIRMSEALNEMTSLIAVSFKETSPSAERFLTEGTANEDWNSYTVSSMKGAMNITEETTTEEAQQVYETYRNDAAEVMEKMLEGLNNVGTGSVESLLLVSSALSTATAVYPILNRDSQDASSSLVNRLVRQLNERTIDSTQEELQQVAENIISTISSTFGGSTMQLDTPISGDYEKAREVWDYDTNLYSDEPWLDGGGTVDETLNNLQNFTNNKLQKKTSEKVVSTGLSNILKLAESILRNMVPGEKPVDVQKGGMTVYITKQTASKLSSCTYEGQGASITVPDYCELRPEDCEGSDDSDQRIISVTSSSQAKNPFNYDSKTENYKEPSSTSTVKTSSPDSASVSLEYFDEDGQRIPIKNTLSPIRLLIPNRPSGDQPVAKFARKTVPASRATLLINELISVETSNVSLMVQFANVTDYDHLAVFVRHGNKTDLQTNEFDAHFLIDVSRGPMMGDYMGCYQDNVLDRAMNGSETYSLGEASSVQICINICGPQEFSYAGLQNGVECFCGNQYSKHGLLDDAECNITCPGNSEQHCGGSMRLSVYSTGHLVNSDPVMVTVDESIIQGRTGTFYVSFAPLQSGIVSINDTKNYTSVLQYNATFSYSVKSSTAGCYWFNEETNSLSSEGCTVGKETTPDMVECFCNHLTSFAGGWVVAPNTIDFSSLDFDPTKNPTIYITLSVIAALYTILAIWARRADRKDLSKLGCIVMDSNDPLDRYLYEVSVNTGSRKEGGTKSKVQIIVAGDLDETDVRALNSTPDRPILRRGQQDSFLMAVPRPLGPLQYIRVWHDNSGKGSESSWFLNYIMLRDLQSGDKYHFIANKWLAVDEEDGEIDRVIPIAGDDEINNFSYLFTETSKRNFTDDHLWFSIFTRPPTSRFTRLQRVSCCLLLLMLSMVTSAMFYEKDNDSSVGLKIGPFMLTPEQVAIGFYTNLIVFAVSILVIQLFRKSRLRYKRPSKIKEAVKQNQIRSAYYMGAANVAQSELITASSISDTYREKKDEKKKKAFMLPWWCRIIAWMLLWVATIACSVFVFLYSIDFGNDKTAKWLTSLVIAFLSSVLITQPVKVILVAVIFSLVVKNPNMDIDEEWLDDEEEFNLNNDEEWQHQDQGYAFKPSMRFGRKPFNQRILANLREKRKKEVEMYAVIREIFLYCMFISVLVVLSAGVQGTKSYRYKQHMEQMFVKKGDRFHNDYNKIRNVSNFWYWTRNTLIPELRASEWYNNQPPVGMRGFLSDYTSRIMGYAVIRQLRTPINTCGVPVKLTGHIRECVASYDIWNDEKRDFGAYWDEDTQDAENNPEFIHRTALDLDGLPYIGEIGLYDGGGYVFELNKGTEYLMNRTKLLEDQAWIDRYTRAIFIEFTVYNPGTNLFAINTLLLEKPDSGSFYPVYRFSPIKLLHYVGNGAIFQIACHVIFAVFIIGFMVAEIRKIKRQRKEYFKELWSWIEMTIIFLAILSSALYVVQYVMVKRITEKFKVTQGNAYMKFEMVKLWSEVYIYTFSLLVFFTIIKLIKLLRFNKKMLLVSETLKDCGRNLALFSIVFGIVFFSFVQFFHIILLRDMLQFVTLWRALMTSFAMMLGRFDFQGMTHSNPLSPIFFILFMVVNMFILLNMLLSIVIESFTAAKTAAESKKNDYEIIDYMVNRFKSWTGLTKPTEFEEESLNITADMDEGENSDMVGQFPVRIELLLSSIKKCYIEGIMYTAGPQGKTMKPAPSKASLLKLKFAKGLFK